MWVIYKYTGEVWIRYAHRMIAHLRAGLGSRVGVPELVMAKKNLEDRWVHQFFWVFQNSPVMEVLFLFHRWYNTSALWEYITLPNSCSSYYTIILHFFVFACPFLSPDYILVKLFRTTVIILSVFWYNKLFFEFCNILLGECSIHGHTSVQV